MCGVAFLHTYHPNDPVFVGPHRTWRSVPKRVCRQCARTFDVSAVGPRNSHAGPASLPASETPLCSRTAFRDETSVLRRTATRGEVSLACTVQENAGSSAPGHVPGTWKSAYRAQTTAATDRSQPRCSSSRHRSIVSSRCAVSCWASSTGRRLRRPGCLRQSSATMRQLLDRVLELASVWPCTQDRASRPVSICPPRAVHWPGQIAAARSSALGVHDRDSRQVDAFHRAALEAGGKPIRAGVPPGQECVHRGSPEG